MKRIKDLRDIDRPREKLQRKGAQALSEFELIEVIIGSGNSQVTVEQLSSRVQKVMQSSFNSLNYDELASIKGLGVAKTTEILAAIELAKRYVISNDKPLLATQDLLNCLADIRTKQQEYLVCLSLDGARRLIARRVIIVGTLDNVLIHPREVFAGAIADRAAGIVIGHNHPSGEVKPSNFDIGFNQQLIAASQIIGIELIDNLIVSKRDDFSFREEGMI